MIKDYLKGTTSQNVCHIGKAQFAGAYLAGKKYKYNSHVGCILFQAYFAHGLLHLDIFYTSICVLFNFVSGGGVWW